jgi:Putative peptidoglycan binding domain/Caspase domain
MFGQRIAAALIIALAAFASLPAAATPPRAALVIGEATYDKLPLLTRCARSANVVAAALRGLGFTVTQSDNASSGGVDGGTGMFSQHLSAGDGTAVIYVCGYGMVFQERAFFLPTSARIARPADALTQGVLAKSLLRPMSHGGVKAGLVVFDLSPAPATPAGLGLKMLTSTPVPDGVGIIAASELTPANDTTSAAPTPLATALAAALRAPGVRTGDVVAAVRTGLASVKLNALALHDPVRSADLVAAPTPPPAPVATPPAPVAAAPASGAKAAPASGARVAPASGSVGATAASGATTPSPEPAAGAAPMPPGHAGPGPVAAPAATARLPEEDQMTDADRRMIQTALTRLGYYDRAVDGIIGPDTRAAIRRYQHEIGADMTGTLTAAQATRLVETH